MVSIQDGFWGSKKARHIITHFFHQIHDDVTAALTFCVRKRETGQNRYAPKFVMKFINSIFVNKGGGRWKLIGPRER